jgi:hypothetical protein
MQHCNFVSNIQLKEISQLVNVFAWSCGKINEINATLYTSTYKQPTRVHTRRIQTLPKDNIFYIKK